MFTIEMGTAGRGLRFAIVRRDGVEIFTMLCSDIKEVARRLLAAGYSGEAMVEGGTTLAMLASTRAEQDFLDLFAARAT